jgi:UDP-4-amino-4,6-dideoxy-N-acetyl-beta-L-altrosamine transaminase
MGLTEKPLPYAAQLIDEADLEAVRAQLLDPWLTQGPRVAEFEARLAEAVGARFCVAVANGTAALHLACLAAGVREGNAALVADNTFVATANGVRYAGGRPILVDIDPSTGLVDVDALEKAAEAAVAAGRTLRAILPVHFSGTVPDMARIRALANRHGAMVIEDAAHALGATYEVDGRSFFAASCAHSDMAILSFHAVKHITTGEGGAITTNDPKLYQALLDLRTHGITRDPARLRRSDGPWYYEQQSLGFNYRITDFQCALGLSQLKKLPQFLQTRRALAARYDAAFADPMLRQQLCPLQVPAKVTSAYHLYVVRTRPRANESLEGVAARRLALFEGLRAAKIMPQVHYIPVHRQPDFSDAGFAEGSFEGADAYYAGCISLPMFPGMAASDVDRVVTALRQLVASW